MTNPKATIVQSADDRTNGPSREAAGFQPADPVFTWSRLDWLDAYKAASYAIASYDNRFTRSMFVPSMRMRRVGPSRRGECS